MTELPKGWKLLTLSEVAKWGSGGTPTSGRSDYYNGDIPWAVIGDMNDSFMYNTEKLITREGLDSSSAKLVPVGAVLIAMYGSIGKLGIAGIPMATNQAIAFALPNEEVILQKFLFWFLRSQRDLLLWSGKGATQQNISQTVLKAWQIPLPSIPEQHQIVETLQDHLSRLDAALTDVKQARAKLYSLKLSWMHTRLAHLSEVTRILQLGEISDTRLGKMLDSKKNAGKLTPYLRNINVQWGQIDVSDMKQVPLSEDERSLLALENGDLLVCEGGEPGRCAIWIPTQHHPQIVCFQKALHRIRPNEEFRSRYLALIIEHAVQSGYASRFFTGTTIKHLPQEQLRKIPVPALSLSAQDDLLREFDELDSINMKMSNSIAEILNSLNSLRRSLLQTAFTGQLTREVTHV